MRRDRHANLAGCPSLPVRASGTLRRLAALLCLAAFPAWAEPPAILSVDITPRADEDYQRSIDIIKSMGATATSLSLAWDDLEPAGTYAPADDWPAIANSYYPAQGMALNLTFSVIDTVQDRRPTDLRTLAWDDPAVMSRFQTHLTDVLTRMPDVDLVAISIGNEIDAHLTDAAQIAAFATFLRAARTEVHRLRPKVPVAAKLTAAGLLSDPDRWQTVMDAGDAAFVTYYPLDADFSVRPPDAPLTDLPALVTASRNLPLYVLEAGYPSAGCTTTPTDQSAFYRALLTAWDMQADRIPLISLTWLNDISRSETQAYADYYGLPDDCFARYLASLGLRDTTGTPKPALTLLLSRP